MISVVLRCDGKCSLRRVIDSVIFSCASMSVESDPVIVYFKYVCNLVYNVMHMGLSDANNG